jgi:hypothetical protein
MINPQPGVVYFYAALPEQIENLFVVASARNYSTKGY